MMMLQANPDRAPDRSDAPQETGLARELPHNIEAEQALLGALLINNAVLDRIGDVIGPADFHDPLHGEIMRVAAATIEAGRVANPITLRASFEGSEPLSADMTVPQYLGRLVVNATTIINALDYARTLRDLAIRRHLIMIGEDIVTTAHDSRADIAPTAQIETAEQELCALAESHEQGEAAAPVSVAFDEAIARIEAGMKRGGKMAGISTGLADLDRRLGGLEDDALYIAAGRPGVGKTSFVLGLAWHAACHEMPVDFYSLEMPRYQLAARLLSSETGIASDRMRRGDISDSEFADIMTANRRIARAPLHIDHRGGISIGQLQARARRNKRRHGTKLIVIDYIQLMRGSGRRNDNRVNEVTEITTGLKALAKELHVPVLALSQLSRGVESRENKRPLLSDLRECLPGSSMIANADTGERIPIERVVTDGLRFNVWAMNDALRLVKRQIVDAWAVERKPLLRITTETGRTIACSAGHRLRTDCGWVKAGDLTDASVLATPRVLRRPTQERRDMSVDAAFVLGLLLGNGWIGGTPAITMPAHDNPEMFMEPARRAFGISPTVKPERLSDKALKITLTMGRMCGAKKNPLTRWLRDIGVWGKTAAFKRIPEIVMQQELDVIAACLRGLFQADGSVINRSGRPQVKLVSISEGLVRDVQHLLMRFGIVSVVLSERHSTESIINGKALRNSTERIWSLKISGSDTALFASQIGLIGVKGSRLVELLEVPKMNDASIIDRLPISINQHVTARRYEMAMSHRDLGWRDQGKRMSRKTALAVAERLDDPLLADMATSDVLWERVKLIEPAGEAMTYDITVDGLHNFVADDFITHNSGSIEQDADAVMFLYREEYYLGKAMPPEHDFQKTAEWQQKMAAVRGKGEVIIAKNRSGPEGVVEVAFDGALTRFSNLARDDMAGGGRYE